MEIRTPGGWASTGKTWAPLWPVRLRVSLQHEGRHYHGDGGEIMRSAAALVRDELTDLLGDTGELEGLHIEAADIDATRQGPDGCCPVTASVTAHLTLLIAADSCVGADRMAIAVLRLRLFRARTFTADFGGAETVR